MSLNIQELRPKLTARRLGRILFLKIGNLFYVAFCRLGFAFVGYRSLSVGGCRFFGRSEFLELSTGAMKMLSHEDSEVYSSLLSRGAWFWHHSTKSVSGGVASPIFSVTDNYLKLGVHGMAARIVWAHFEMTAFEGIYLLPNERELATDIYNIIQAQTFTWLQQHEFPEPLTQHFAGSVTLRK